MSLPSYESAFRTRLQKKLDEAFQRKSEDLGLGSACSQTASSTSNAYHREVGYLQALRDVAGLMEEVEDDLLGRQRE